MRMDTKDKTEAKAEAGRLIDALGGTSVVAALCQTSLSAVSQWRENGIPDARLMFLRVIRPEMFPDLVSGAPSRRATDAIPSSGHPGRQPPSPHNILDTVPTSAVVSAIPTSKD